MIVTAEAPSVPREFGYHSRFVSRGLGFVRCRCRRRTVGVPRNRIQSCDRQALSSRARRELDFHQSLGVLDMFADRYDLAVSTASAAARDAYVQGCDRALTFYPGAIEAFDR